MQALASPNVKLRFPALEVTADISRGSARHIAPLYGREFVAALGLSATRDQPRATQRVLATLTNVALSVDAVFDDLCAAGLLERFAQLLSEEGPAELRADLLDFFKMLLYRENTREADVLLNDLQLLGSVLRALADGELGVLKAAMECLEALLDCGRALEEAKSENIVREQLQGHAAFTNFERTAFSPHSIVAKYHKHISAKFDL